MFIITVLLAALIGILVIISDVPSSALIAFIGVLIGAVVTSIIQYWMSEGQLAQNLRLAALDRRLETSQDAYSLWRRPVFADKQSNEVFDVVRECEAWWDENCLFLSNEARKAFRNSYLAASDHARFLKTHESSDLIRKTWSEVIRAGSVIERSVMLPSISNHEALSELGEPNSDDA